MTAILISHRSTRDIPDEDLQASEAALQTLQASLLPHLISLNSVDRLALAKMGAKTVDFVSKTLGYAQENPQLRPTFVDIDEFAANLVTVGQLRALLRPLAQLHDMVNDTMLFTGSETYSAALACYTAFKSAAKLNMPGAVTISDDLSSRFPGRPQKPRKPATPEPAGSAPGAAAS